MFPSPTNPSVGCSPTAPPTLPSLSPYIADHAEPLITSASLPSQEHLHTRKFRKYRVTEHSVGAEPFSYTALSLPGAPFITSHQTGLRSTNRRRDVTGPRIKHTHLFLLRLSQTLFLASCLASLTSVSSPNNTWSRQYISRSYNPRSTLLTSQQQHCRVDSSLVPHCQAGIARCTHTLSAQAGQVTHRSPDNRIHTEQRMLSPRPTQRRQAISSPMLETPNTFLPLRKSTAPFDLPSHAFLRSPFLPPLRTCVVSSPLDSSSSGYSKDRSSSSHSNHVTADFSWRPPVRPVGPPL